MHPPRLLLGGDVRDGYDDSKRRTDSERRAQYQETRDLPPHEGKVAMESRNKYLASRTRWDEGGTPLPSSSGACGIP